MDREKQIELSLELGPGDFSLRMDGVTMTVRMKENNGALTTPHIEVKPMLPSGMVVDKTEAVHTPLEKPNSLKTDQLAEELHYYREVSQEIYEGLGKLAKEINLSIQDLSLAEILQTGMTSPGDNLDQVRTQVADVLQMTETATLNILSLVEQIQEDCLKVQAHLLTLSHTAEHEGEAIDPGDVETSEKEDKPLDFTHIFAQGEKLDRLLRSAFQEITPTEGENRRFPLSDILQILLEFCGNESVKPHLKSVHSQQENLFLTDETEQAIAELAADVPQEDGIYQFPLDQVLKILEENTKEERVKELFAKLMDSAAKIFPISTLPLEGNPLEPEPGDDPQSELLLFWEEFFQNFKSLLENPETQGLPASPGLGKATKEVAQEALTMVERINESLSKITEALAFQDLSGQRLHIILKILSQLQVQVLTLLVAAGNKLKTKMEGKDFAPTDSEISAQEELDRLLHIITRAPADMTSPEISPTEQQPLDQEAINELLTSMGF